MTLNMPGESDRALYRRQQAEVMRRHFDEWVARQSRHSAEDVVWLERIDGLRIELFGPDDVDEAKKYAQQAYDALMSLDGLGIEEVSADLHAAVDALIDLSAALKRVPRP
jgi:isopentenyl diphosphate isomerase/L-lactate dehydrogenase-like FMN-dependent dehydrogenase